MYHWGMNTPLGKNVYLVGGAVRDKRLGITVKDRDWVVVGSSPETLANAGYKPVGKDFPVFLHPESHEEYALARTERKSGRGYHGFTFNTDSGVTLEEDLERRDLTINAMAETLDGELIDPFNGAKDIENRVLRHVSDAFLEDPVRILRVAKFMARFAHLGFTVAPDTVKLMQSMVSNGEVDHLVPERVWQEMHNALGSTTPRAFIETLQACGALKVLLPEANALFGVPQREEYHPEIDTGIHTLMVMDQCAMLASGNASIAYCALCHDFGKALTPTSELPAHRGHEERGVEPTNNLSDRLRVPKQFKQLATLVTRWHLHAHRAFELTPKTLHKLLLALDVMRKPERFEDFLMVCMCDMRGRGGQENNEYPQLAYLQGAAKAIRSVDSGKIAAGTEDKLNIPEAIRLAQRDALQTYTRKNQQN